MMILRKIGLLLTVFFIFSSLANAAYQLNMTRGVTPVSHAVYDLHMLVFWVCVVITVIVFGVMFYALIVHRKSVGAKSARFHEHTTVEVIWAIIPFLILIAMAIPATKVLIMMDDSKSAADLNIKITAHAEKSWTKEELLEKGQKTFLTYCAVCHQSTGLGLPPTFPALKGSKIASVPDQKGKHIDIVLHGVQGTAMVAYGLQLSDVDLAAVITYVRNAWGNNTGDVIQPTEIQQVREKK